MNEDELEKERMRRVEVAGKYGDLIQKIQIKPGLVWLECTEGFAAQWSGRKLWPSDIRELNEIIAKQNDWLCIENQRLQMIEKFKHDLEIAIEALEFYAQLDMDRAREALKKIEAMNEKG